MLKDFNKLNETNRGEVQRDVLAWLRKTVP
jgi:hypothetical protein